MKHKFDFNIGDKVYITELKINGVVLNILIDRDGIQYKVRYFGGTDPKEVYFYSSELTLGENNDRLGFKV